MAGSRLLLLVSRWRSRRPPWQPTEVIPLLLLWPEFGVEVVFLAVSLRNPLIYSFES